MGKPRKKKPKAVKRSRGRSLQVYLSDEEGAIFDSMLERENTNQAGLVRAWLKRAQAQYNRRHSPRSNEPPPVDPRQLAIPEATP